MYLVDLNAAEQTGRYEYRRLDINSDQSDYWKSWSSNSRWIAFSSKRKDGIFTRIYFSYVDDEGVVHKPFVLAQKDPTYYDSLFKVYQIPELTKSPIPVTGGNLARFVRSPKRTFTQIPVTSATPTAIPDYDQKWLRQE